MSQLATSRQTLAQKRGSGHYRQEFGSVIMQFAEHSVSAAMVAAITESDSKRQKIEKRMLLTSDGGPYLVSGIPGRWFKFLKRIQIFSSENWSQGGSISRVTSVHKLIFIQMRAEHIVSEQHTESFSGTQFGR